MIQPFVYEHELTRGWMVQQRFDGGPGCDGLYVLVDTKGTPLPDDVRAVMVHQLEDGIARHFGLRPRDWPDELVWPPFVPAE